MAHSPEAARVWFRFIRLQARINAAMADELKALALSIPQCDVLTTLTEREGISQQELAGRLYVTKGNISGLVDRLVAAGLVERRVTRDRRSHALHLTPDGRGRADAAIAVQARFVDATLGRLPPMALGTLDHLLGEIREAVLNRSQAPQP